MALRTAGSFITPKYTSYEGKIYYTETGLEITNPDETTQKKLMQLKKLLQLATSDAIQTGDLIRFFDNGLPALDSSQYNYIDSLAAEISLENKLGTQSTSLYSKTAINQQLNYLKHQAT